MFIIALPFSLLTGQSIVLGIGNTEGITITSSNNSVVSGATTMSQSGFLPNHNKSSRFLSQATLGYNMEEIEKVNEIGIEDWIDEQINLPISYTFESAVKAYHQLVRDSLVNRDPTIDPNSISASIRYWDYAWWQYHMTQPDLLRQRIALALSEILVISTKSGFGNEPYAFGSFYDILMRHSFGNYRDILQEVTYHPAMGSYLTYLANPKSDTIRNIFPDENYAREVMQLFSIGLDSLNLDGTVVYDTITITADSFLVAKVPTYDNTDIAEYSKIFTGLIFGDRTLDSKGFKTNALNDTSWALPMQMNDAYHEPGLKYLFNNQSVGSQNTVDGDRDISEALDNLFAHPNVGPFISKLLIQRLVTSNPSPQYVERVASMFNNNGNGIKGDLASTVRAILLDPEASNCQAKMNTKYGMMREPFIRYVHSLKAFDLATQSGRHRNAMRDVYDDIEQKPFASPSVFNFFQQDYQPIGPLEQEGLFAPEFQISNSQTIIGYLNGLNQWIVRDDPTDEWGLFSNENIPEDEKAFIDISDEIALAGDDDQLHILVDRLNMLLAHGNLSATSTQLIVDALKKFPLANEGDIEDRTRIAIYMVMSSPEYIINR